MEGQQFSGRGGYQGSKPKKPICQFFNQPQGCKKGNQCNFYHPKQSQFAPGGGSGDGVYPEQQDPQNYVPNQSGDEFQGQSQYPGMSGSKGPGGYKKTAGFVDKTKQACKFGANCNKRDTCSRLHPDQMTGGGKGNQLGPSGPGGMPGTSGTGGSFVPGQKQCNYFQQGQQCTMVKCKFIHQLNKSEVKIKYDQQVVICEGKTVNNAVLYNNKQSLLLLTDDQLAFLYNFSANTTVGPIPIAGRPTALRTFEAFPDASFFGVESKTQMGQSSYDLYVMLSNKTISKAGVHLDTITDIEYTFFSGQHIFLTCSNDKTIKAWSIDEPNNTFKQVAENPLPANALQMQLVNPNFLVVSLGNGSFYGWTFDTNRLDQIQAHKAGVVTLKKYEDFILSGDREGFLQIRSISNGYNMAVSEAQLPKQTYLRALNVLKFKGDMIVLVGDDEGFINAVKYDGPNPICGIFGAFNDDKNFRKQIVNIFQIEENSFYAIGSNGIIRRWLLS